MSLLSLQEITLSFGGLPVLHGVTLQIEPGERVCLVGRNGEGKSSLMKVISGELAPDSGTMVRQQGLKLARLSQEVPAEISGTVYQVIATGLGELQELLVRHYRVAHQLAARHDEALLAELDTLQHQLDAAHGWQAQQRVESVISRLALDADLDFATLSGGLKRRVLLGRTLVGEPDLLLLDEPTNHLDIAAITWLEEFLLSARCALLFVTHDRMLLQKLATRIVNLDRGRLTSWPGDYANYLRRREEELAAEESQQRKFDKKLAEEEVWIRQGIKARRTRNEGRVRELKALREERRQRRECTGTARMQLQAAESSGRLVAEARNVSGGYGGTTIIRDCTTTIMRGDKVGIIGPNGAGKTTLLRLLLGELAPQEGTVRLGTNLAVAYFDQQRAMIDGEKTVADNVGEGNDTVVINGRPRHIIGYLQDFLFTPDRARTPARVLSGGERNRLLLAKLLARPANVLVMDEPTNDLDAETLELLEELLFDFSGTLLLVSHDRAFLNNVVTSTLVFEENGRVQEYAGGYDDWLAQRPPPATAAPPPRAPKLEKPKARPAGPRKLTFKETRELEELPGRIEALEAEQLQLSTAMATPAFYQQEGDTISRARERMAALEKEVATAYARWEELEAALGAVSSSGP